MSAEKDLDPINKYTKMQKTQYEADANRWNIHNLDPVVGSFNAHNSWSDYEFLFKDIEDLKTKSVLDFGCGPGRNLVKYSDTFARIDGVDIASKNLENAVLWMKYNKVDPALHKLILCNGVNLSNIPNDEYDIVMSTICMQHICVYEIRLNYLKEFYRVLKPGGYVTIQMGYGVPSPQSVDYYENNYDALSTNRGCDTNISDYTQVEKDLMSIGFKNFKYTIRPTGPGDCHPSWIFFHAQK
jgi:ubiquinone/menaquinone biosynthesis C-methylase UbiE